MIRDTNRTELNELLGFRFRRRYLLIIHAWRRTND